MNQIDIFDIMRQPVQITKPIRLIELFAGYGSQAMALKRIGADFEHYRVVEFDKYAVASYNAVHGTDFPPLDITKIHAEDLNICYTEMYCYLMTYSFPCTDLSLAGKRAGMKKGSGTRSGLLWEVERILREIKESGGELPQILFMENVPQVHADANGADFQSWIECGYSVVNPAAVNSMLPEDTTYEQYMNMSFTMIDMCDALYMLKGWENSCGANREFGYALGQGKKISYEQEQIIQEE